MLVASFGINLDEYNEAIKTESVEQINEYYIRFLLQGLKNVKDEFNLPKDKIIEGIELFRQNNYVNRWLIAKRRVVGSKLSCRLEGRITLDYFCLELVILDQENEIKRVELIRMDPDPIIYSNHIGGMKVTKEGIIQISNRSKKVFYSKSVHELV